MSARVQPIHRILVAIDSSPASLAALEGAAALAARLPAELLGVFVEDENLLRLAELPFATEVGTLSAGYQPVGLELMEQRLRSQAARAEQALSVTARRHECQAEFRVVRGQVVGQLMAAIEQTDLAALGSVGVGVVARSGLGITARLAIDRATRPLLLLPPGGSVRAPIAVVHDGSQFSGHALELARHLNEGKERMLHVLAVADGDAAGMELAKSAKLLLDQMGMSYRLHVLPVRQVELLLSALRSESVGTVVLVSDPGPWRTELTQRLLLESNCAVMLAGA